MPSKFNKNSTKSNYGRLTNLNEKLSSDIVKGEKFWYDYPFTIICAVFMTVLHLGFWILSPTNVFLAIPNQFVAQFALYNPYVINDFFNNWFRLFTSIFIHGDIFHLGGNLLFFAIFSIRLEELKGTKVTLLVFIISGLAGNLLTILIVWNGPLISLGASGAVNGVFMADLVTMRKSYDKGSLTMLAFLVVFGSFTLAGAHANFFAHAGGLIGGAATMLFFEKVEKKGGNNYSYRID